MAIYWIGDTDEKDLTTYRPAAVCGLLLDWLHHHVHLPAAGDADRARWRLDP